MEVTPTLAQYSHGISSKMDHTLGHKVSLNKHKKTEIISY
jgi:hypothetical protein